MTQKRIDELKKILYDLTNEPGLISTRYGAMIAAELRKLQNQAALGNQPKEYEE